jgi:hypothetical protein
MALGDKYVITLNSTYTPDPANGFANVFAYEGSAGAPNAADLWSTFSTGVVTAIVDVLSTLMVTDLLSVINLDDPSDFFASISGLGGTRTGQVLPKFNAWEYEYVRATRAVHNGRKSFGVICEADVTNGEMDFASVGTEIDALETALVDVLNGGSGNQYTPKIWRRAGTYVSGTFPDTFYPISGVLYRRVSTQNTRKR